MFTSESYTALQYWFFYYFNDWRNNHEGDWEQVTLIFNTEKLSEIVHEGIKPNRVGYSQHEAGMRATWEQLEDTGSVTEETQPVVYVALGSHANYFQSGDYVRQFGRAAIDEARGTFSPSYNIQLLPDNPETASCEDGGWLEYAGFWGEFVIREESGISGPRGPKFQKQNAWDDPIGWVDERTDELWDNCERILLRCRVP